MKIKSQVYIISFVSSIIPLAILSFFIFTLLGENLRRSEREKVELILVKGESHLERMFGDLESKLNILGEIYMEHEAEELQEYMEIFSGESSEVEYFAFGAVDGGMYVGDDSDDVFPESYDPRIRPWYTGALSKEGFYVSEVFTHAVTNQPAVTISKRIMRGDQLEGVIAALLKLESIGSILDRFKNNTVKNYFLLDNHGHLLINTAASQGILKFVEESSVSLLREEAVYYGTDRNRKILYPYRMKLAGLILVGGSLEQDMLKPVSEVRRMVIILLVGTFLLTTLLILVFGRKFSESVRRLSYIIDNVARGNYTKNMKQLDSYIDASSELYLVKEAIKNMQNEIKKRELALKRISQTDALTEIYNKGAITEIIRMEVERASTFGSEFSLIMFDLDHFKGINDTYGHPFGDEVLKGISREVSRSLKGSDIFGRYGGEEFLILLSDTGIDEGRGIAERLRRKIYAMEWENNIKVSASFGIAERDGERSFEELIVKVDGALYRAKKNGRNRVEGVMKSEVRQPKK